MIKKNTIAYWILFLTALIAACGNLCVVPTYAHYQKNIYCNTVVQAEEPVTSDCMIEGGQTVLLGEVEQTTTVSIRFYSRSDTYGLLSCQLVNPAQGEYLSVFLSSDVVYLSGGTSSVDLFLTPTENALLLTEDLDVDILVVCSTGEQTLSATFRATLPGVYVELPSEEENEESGEGDGTGEGEGTTGGEGDNTPPEGGDTT